MGTVEKKRRRLRPKTFVTIGLLGGAGLFCIWFYQYNQAPATGTVFAPREQLHTQGVATTRFKSASVLFDYPTHYSLENKQVVAPLAEQYVLNMHNGQESRRISVTVRKPRPGEDVYEDSAYKFRKNTIDSYQESAVTLNGMSAKKMTKKDGSEITYFIPGGAYYAIFAATSTNARTAFAEEIDTVMKSFVWVK
jgi:hypothetical protein